MKIETFASSSTGNAYRISDGHTTLLLECGIPFRKLQKCSGYTLSEISACLITHEHGDHAKAVGNLIDFGMPIWCSQGTAEKLNILQAPGVQILQHLKPARCKTMEILPFSVFHDAAEPLGWLITSTASGERLFFLTDTGKAEYSLPPVHHIMIECNHLGVDAMGATNAFLARSVAENHLSLDACVSFLLAQDLSEVQDIRLLHISNAHGDPQVMRDTVARATGKMIIV